MAQSVWRWAAGWTIGVLGVESRRGLEVFLFSAVCDATLRPARPPVWWVQGALSLGMGRPGRGADHSPPSGAEVGNAWSCASAPQRVFMARCLVGHRDKFTFTLLLI
jgi:hypothetical protein